MWYNNCMSVLSRSVLGISVLSLDSSCSDVIFNRLHKGRISPFLLDEGYFQGGPILII